MRLHLHGRLFSLIVLATTATACDLQEETSPEENNEALLSRPGSVESAEGGEEQAEADERDDESDSAPDETEQSPERSVEEQAIADCWSDCVSIAFPGLVDCQEAGGSDEDCSFSFNSAVTACGEGCYDSGVDEEQPEPTPDLPPSEPASGPVFYFAYACSNDWEIIQGVGLSEEEALGSCLMMMAHEPGFNLRCIYDGRTIYDGCTPGTGELPTSNELYQGSFCDEGPFIQSYGVGRGDALANCRVNATLNPERGLRCTYGEEVLYESCAAVLPQPVDCDGWEPAPFARVPEFVDPNNWSADLMRCSGPTFRRFDARYGLWVGLVSCGAGYRFYLSEEAGGPYLPAADGAGHGQDLCELVNPAFVLPYEDDISSGDCSGCSIGSNYSFVGGEVYGRSAFGEPFTRTEAPAGGNYQSSVIACGVGPVECGIPTL
jgi:hypothetical protein